jgi:hypothetical protein
MKALIKQILIQHWYFSLPTILLIAAFICYYFKSTVKSIIDDTLKREVNGKLHWSPTKLTMASAWWVVLWSYHYDLIKSGFNEFAFGTLTAVALGSKITDAVSKKLNPLVQPPPTMDTKTTETTITNNKMVKTETEKKDNDTTQEP